MVFWHCKEFLETNFSKEILFSSLIVLLDGREEETLDCMAMPPTLTTPASREGRHTSTEVHCQMEGPESLDSIRQHDSKKIPARCTLS